MPHPYQEADAVEFINRSEIAWTERNAARFVIILKNQIVGGIGLERHHKSLFELGYWIARRYWHKGIATEAVSEIINFGNEQLAASGTTASCHKENWRSEKVLLKANFSKVGTESRFSAALGKEIPEIQFLREPTNTERSISLSH